MRVRSCRRAAPAVLATLLACLIAWPTSAAETPPAAGPPAAEASPSPAPTPAPEGRPAQARPVRAHPAVPDQVEEKILIPIFGRVKIFRPEPLQQTRGVILFLSGDGGFRGGIVDMARRGASKAIVVGLSLPAYRRVAEKTKEKCWYPAGELEETAQAVEKIYRLPRYLKPILVGFSSGATAAYGALAQAPAEAFAGGVSLGFCPKLDLERPWCGRGDWKPAFQANRQSSILPARPDIVPRADGEPRWTILQGTNDRVCDPAMAARFAESIPAARIVPLPKVRHGFSVARNWVEAYDRAIDRLLDPRTAWEPALEEARAPAVNPGPEAIRKKLAGLDLPLEIEWPESPKRVVLFVSGDGGWAELDQRVAAALSSRGVAVIGWNALRYFWQPKTPDRFRADLMRVLQVIPDGVRIFAGGYSFGAEVVPATVATAPARPGNPLDRLAGLVLIAPGPYAAYEVSPLDWLRTSEPETEHSVLKSLKALEGLPILCLEPSDRAVSGCADGAPRSLTRVVMPGGHHFSGDFEGIAGHILSFLETASSSPPPGPPAGTPIGPPAPAPGAPEGPGPPE